MKPRELCRINLRAHWARGQDPAPREPNAWHLGGGQGPAPRGARTQKMLSRKSKNKTKLREEKKGKRN